jgi:hypothetical protein
MDSNAMDQRSQEEIISMKIQYDSPRRKCGYWNRFGIVGTLVLLSVAGLEGRLRFIGPNPYYSFLTFPQDSRLFTLGSTFSFFYLNQRGWMGHLDVPELSPSPTYVDTEESADERLQSGLDAQVGFKGTWFSPEIMMAPYVFSFKSVRIIPLVSGKLDRFHLHSSGLAVPHDNPAGAFPFSSDLAQRNAEGSVGVLASAQIKNIPVGIMVNYRACREGRPSGYLQFTQNGSEVRLNRYNWGWSTLSSCNHIFGESTNIDAFWEDSYTDTAGSQFDAVLGADIKENKLGFRFRRLTEYGDDYEYSSDANQYLKSPYRRKAAKTLLRASELFKMTEFEGAKLFLCVVTEGDFLRQHYLKEGTELLNFYRENAYDFELLPVLHFDLEGGGFFRIGTSASFFYKDYGNREIWGQQEVYSPGWTSLGWEASWERSSYGRTFTFINFSEADLELPLIERWNVLLSLDVWSHQVWSRTKRFYGDNVEENGAFRFTKEAERTNTLRESWFGGTFGLMAGKRLSVGLFLDLPVYYDKFIGTDVQIAGESFWAKANPQPAIRKPVSLWALIIMRW